jgi:mannobiose 2-epimerase
MISLMMTVPATETSASALTGAERDRLTTILHQADGNFRESVMPFWTRATWDDKNGGYLTDVDRKGNPKPGGDKYTIMTARMIWTLSAAHAYGIRDRGYLELAGKGVKFLTSKMWDPQYGGFYMSVKEDNTPDDTRKYTYCQEFVVYALSEYARVSGDKGALAWAEKTYDFCKQKAGDGDLGFHEDFDREWKPLPDSLGVGGVRSGKTLNVHMHMMEALTALTDASQSPKYKAELAHLTDLLLAKVIDRKDGCAMEPFDRMWHPVPDGKGRISTFYGHNVEMAWLLKDAWRALGRDREKIRPIFCGLLDNALKYGIDLDRGGIAGIGPYNHPVIDDPRYKDDIRQKEWWEQAESLVAFSEGYEWTHDPRYLHAFEKQWDWVWKHQIDQEDGDWFTEVKWDTGEPLTVDKGMGGWKVCYHNGRALMRTSTALRAILKQR